MFEACNDRTNPDSHNYLVPICEECKAWSNHWNHDEENPNRHDFIAPTEPLVWGENAHRENKCERIHYVDPDEDYPDGVIHCDCPCHWSEYYVNAYLITRAFGGQEEGGWWYDTGYPVASMPFDTLTEALEFRKVMEKKYPYTGQRGSMLDREPDYDVIVEPHYGRPFPEETPRYS